MGMWFAGGTDENDKLDRKATTKVLRRTFRRVRPYRTQALRAAGLLVVFALTSLAGPLLVRRAIDNGLSVGDRGALNQSIIGYVIVAVLAYGSYRMAIATLARVGENFLRDLRTGAFDRILRQSMPFYDRENAGVLVSRMTSDIDSLQVLVQLGLLMFVTATLLLFTSLVTLIFLDPLLLVLCLMTMPFVAVASVKFHRESNLAYLAVRERIGTTLTSLQEGISGVRVVQAFAREDVQIESFAETNNGLYRTHMRSVKIGAYYLPVVEMAGALSTALAVGLGGWMVRDGRITLGTVAAFILILQTMFGPMQQLSQLFNMIQSAGAALHKLYGLLDEPLTIDSEPGAPNLPASGHVELDDVSFEYVPGERVLSGVSLTIEEGERVAFVGPTGAGKSTVAKLVARFYDPVEGTIRIGGMDLRTADTDSLREHIVVVPQEGFLFAGTVADNIRLAKPKATDADIRQALDRIGVLDVFERLPQGLDTEVQERGSRLSAGEKQLVSLARAALVDPKVLILDEATSSVDPGTEAIVEVAMESLMEGRTVIAIAHRLSTSERCDRVGVVVDGELVELGPHNELVAAGGHYTELFEAWTSGLAA
ncbi:ABC transporter ATP-binding protein/permease [Acidimicrobiales bacterium]|nr:ABC transporter ATP-binding protein/permease [bacterium]MDC1389384.1 ABC transporter ATP-binding protein/permease [Acidimicrobiales bacterium]